MRKLFDAGELTFEKIDSIMGELKGNQQEKIYLKADRVSELLPKGLSVTEREDYIYKALKHYGSMLRQKKEREAER